MRDVGDRSYKPDNAFFGDEPSYSAWICFNQMKSSNVKKILEIGSGRGKDSLFFASKGMDVFAVQNDFFKYMEPEIVTITQYTSPNP